MYEVAQNWHYSRHNHGLLQIVPSGNPALLKLTFADGKNEELDISAMQAGQVYDHIASRIEERAMNDVLTQNNFVGKKLSTSWGL